LPTGGTRTSGVSSKKRSKSRRESEVGRGGPEISGKRAMSERGGRIMPERSGSLT